MLTSRIQKVIRVQPWPHSWPAVAAVVASGSCSATGAASFASAAAPQPDLRQAFSYCVSQVKQHDYENYLWVTQLPKVRMFIHSLACRMCAAWPGATVM